MRPSHPWVAVAVALGVTVAGCSGGSTGPDRRLAADHAHRPGGRFRFIGGVAARRSCGLLPVHTQPRRPELPRPGADPQRGLRLQDRRN